MAITSKDYQVSARSRYRVQFGNEEHARKQVEDNCKGTSLQVLSVEKVEK